MGGIPQPNQPIDTSPPRTPQSRHTRTQPTQYTNRRHICLTFHPMYSRRHDRFRRDRLSIGPPTPMDRRNKRKHLRVYTATSTHIKTGPPLPARPTSHQKIQRYCMERIPTEKHSTQSIRIGSQLQPNTKSDNPSPFLKALQRDPRNQKPCETKMSKTLHERGANIGRY